MEIKEAFHEIADSVVIVEGKRDKDAVQLMGCRRVLTLQKKALFEVVEAVTEDTVVILTDFDKEGRKVHKELSRMFSQRGVYVDDTVRKLLEREGVMHMEHLSKVA